MRIVQTNEEFVRRAVSKKILERKFGHRGRRYVARVIRRARRSLMLRVTEALRDGKAEGSR